MNERKWLKRGLSSTLIVLFVVSMVTGILAFCRESNKNAGVLTLRFNFGFLDSSLHRRNVDQNRNLIDSIGSHIPDIAGNLETALPNAVSQLGDVGNTAGGSIKTAIPEVLSQARSVANAIATAVPAAIEDILPNNCSIGTTQFCVGRTDSVSCHSLPPNISEILPPEIRNGLEELSSIHNFDTALTKITTRTFQDIWIVGLVLIFLVLISTLASMFGWVLFQRRAWRVLFHSIFGLIFCLPFILTIITLQTLYSQISNLPKWIEVVQGDIMKLFIGGLCCAISLVAFSGALLAIV